MKCAIILLRLPIDLVKLAVAALGLLLIWCDMRLFDLSNRLMMCTSDKPSWAANVEPQPASIEAGSVARAASLLTDILDVAEKGSDAAINNLRVLLEQHKDYQANLSEWKHAFAVDRPARRENIIRIEYAMAIMPVPWKDKLAFEIKRLKQKTV